MYKLYTAKCYEALINELYSNAKGKDNKEQINNSKITSLSKIEELITVTKEIKNNDSKIYQEALIDFLTDLKSIFLDPRIRLFYDNPPDYPDVNPLFTADDIRVFDKYLDGDPFEDADYIRNFRMILDAIKTRTPLNIDSMNRKGNTVRCTLMPEYLEYSEKDDKIRLIGSGCRYGGIINLARIVQCTPSARKFKYKPDKEIQIDHRTVELEVIDHRNALERVLMHFAHFEKQAEKIDQNRYKVLITYDNDDETEMLIRILSFGPMVKVVAPKHFIDSNFPHG